LGVRALAARRRAVLQVQRHVEARPAPGLQLQRAPHEALRAGVVVARGDDGKRPLALEERLLGSKRGVHVPPYIRRALPFLAPPAPAIVRPLRTRAASSLLAVRG